MDERKQRLWIISELFPPEESATGYIMGEIAKTLSSKYDVGVICGPEIYDKSRKQTEVNQKDFNFPVFHANIRTFNKNSKIGKAISFVLTTRSLYKLAKRLIHTKDKVLMVTNPATLLPPMCRLKRKKGFDLTILVHDVFPENTKAAGIRLPIFGKIKDVFDKAYSSADRLIVLGRDMKDVISKKTSYKTHIEIIENWGDFSNIHPMPMPQTDKIIIEYAGNIGRVQGLEQFIERLPDDTEFHLYGSGAIEETLRSYNKPNVFFHGPYTRSEQSKILGECHISLVTLNDKMYGLGTPSKTYNILASGRPILYFGPKDSEVAHMIKKYKIGYCGFPDKWDYEELLQMGENARSIGEKLFDKPIILNKFLKYV